MKPVAAVLVALVSVSPALAQPATDTGQVCVGVTIGGQAVPGIDCLNARLKSMVAAERRQAAQIDLLLGAPEHQAPTQEGVFNEAATAERLGDAFGRSVFPQRPVRSFPSPLTAGK